MGRLHGKVALITGSGRGIGRGIALCLAAEGADVVINDLPGRNDAEATAQEIRALGQQALVWPADISDRGAVEAMIAGAVAHFGRLDIAVANAALSIREPVLEAKWENVQRTIEVAQFGVFHTCQLAARQMSQQPLNGRSRGKLLITCSVHEEIAFAQSAAYNMAKAAVAHLGRTMAGELARTKINVNIINPGWIDTPGERRFFNEEQITEGGKKIPWGRIGTPEDIGKAAAFLVSDDADYITGAVLRVDGGFVHGLELPG
ncbi:MAG: SDR family oxidoreductase [Caldilineaceae bacterium]|nr:SDR family oxidoreductase [Caldilineaceae bacterium]